LAHGRFLLDTGVVVSFLRGVEGLDERLAEAAEVLVSCVTLGELLYGALRSSRVAENRERVEGFLQAATLVGVDRSTAEVYARIKDELRVRGRPIPENDIWIAATARQHGLTLVSSDSHFEEIEALPLTSW
jgi:tRNA(fMet)-specific endonuclease VapC